jgi:enoyl-CoA hydratase/carnithine racemase
MQYGKIALAWFTILDQYHHSINDMSGKEDSMKTVTIDTRERIAVVHLNHGDKNPINLQMINDLVEAQNIIRKDFQGMVLTGNSQFFSIGFDLPALLNFDRPQMADFFYRFQDMALGIYTLPLPTCCAVSGHAIAGGNILALTTDFRFATSEKKLIGLNEIKLGLPVPYLAELMLRQIVGDRVATELLYSGEFMTTSDAGKTGIVDEVFSPEKLAESAFEKVLKIADFSQPAFAAIKATRTESIRYHYEQNIKRKNEYFLDCWFSDAAQALLKEAAKKF